MPYTTLGRAYRRSGSKAFSISLADRLLHLYLVGQTGAGKSTLIRNLALQDAKAGVGFCLIDPHGDLASEVRDRIEIDHTYWDVADPNCPYGYNPLTHISEPYRPLVASGIVDALRKQWPDAWGARMEHVLRYALLLLLEQPSADLRDIMPLLLDARVRERLTGTISDAQVRAFWKEEYSALRYAKAADGVAPIANKLGAFLAHPLVRKAVCEPEHPLRFRTLMDEGQCLIVNLAAGRLGVDTANILGGLILSGLAHAGLSRASTPLASRRAFLIHVDEFHAFTSGALAGMLPQLRKFGIGLTLAHQYLDQVEHSLLSAVLGNAGNVMVFRVGAHDAPLLAKHLAIDAPRDLVGLANFECFARVMVDGVQTKAFTAFTSQER